MDADVPRHGLVLPAFECQAELDRTMAALSAQTYPGSLLQAVIVDDGSEPALEVPAGTAADLDVVILRQENTGFGSGRGRNAGAAVAEGEILYCSTRTCSPRRGRSEAHAALHATATVRPRDAGRAAARRCGWADPGMRRGRAARAGTPEAMQELFAGREQNGRAGGIERFLQRTQRLRGHRLDLFRIFQLGGNAGMLSKSTWDAVGGMHVFGVLADRGDTELGYRLFTHGAVFVPDVEAMTGTRACPSSSPRPRRGSSTTAPRCSPTTSRWVGSGRAAATGRTPCRRSR